MCYTMYRVKEGRRKHGVKPNDVGDERQGGAKETATNYRSPSKTSKSNREAKADEVPRGNQEREVRAGSRIR